MMLSCSGGDETPKALVNILLIDAPAQWDSVIVEIQGVELDFVPNGREGTIQKIFLPYEPGDKEVDISRLVGGVALPVARSEMQLGHISGITLRLGTSNALFLDKKRYPLELPGGNTDYAMPLAVELKSGLSYDLILDFDLERSIQTGTSSPLTFKFNPTITAFSGIGRGELFGKISPPTLRPAIYAINGRDSLSTHTNAAGSFWFRLAPGKYTVFIDPKDSRYLADTLFNISVEAGKGIDLQATTLVKK
jgi:hypothetical protein